MGLGFVAGGLVVGVHHTDIFTLMFEEGKMVPQMVLSSTLPSPCQPSHPLTSASRLHDMCLVPPTRLLLLLSKGSEHGRKSHT